MKRLERDAIARVKPYIPGKPIEEVVRELGIKGDIVKLASNENPLGPSPLAVKAISDSLHEFNLYPDDSVYRLTKEVAMYTGVSTDMLLFGAGSVEILDLIGKTFIEPGRDGIIISEGAFIMYLIIGTIYDADITQVPMKNYTHDLIGMADAVDEKTKVIFIANPNNPTGTMNRTDEVDAFMKRIPDDVLVVFDEAYREYIFEKDFPDTMRYVKEGRNVLILRTFSKIHGLAGIRLGYAIGSPKLIISLRKSRMPFNISTPAQVGATAALHDHNHIKKSIEINEEGKEFLYKELKSLGVFYLPTYANFIFIDPGIDSKVCFEKLQTDGVIVRPLMNYGFKNAIRVSIGTEKMNRRFIASLEKVLRERRI